MEPFTLILEKGLQLAIPEKKQRLSFGVDCVSLLEKICMHKEEKFGKCFYMILLHLLWTFLISKSAFLQIHAEDTILISPMTFWLMVHISKDFNKKNIILEWAFGIYHKELIYKSSAFIENVSSILAWDREMRAPSWQGNKDAFSPCSESFCPQSP